MHGCCVAIRDRRFGRLSVGGVSTFSASWLTQRGQLRTQTLIQQAVKRETLYAEFIVEASRRLAEAWSHHAETPEVVAGLYSALERMRLMSCGEVIRAAEEVIRHVLDAYAAPDLTFEDLRGSMRSEDFKDRLRDFAEACRIELYALGV